MLFSELRIGQTARITGYHSGSKAYKQQLLAMGLVKGAEFRVSKIAPLGDPVVIFVKDYLLSLRKLEADLLKIEKVD